MTGFGCALTDAAQTGCVDAPDAGGDVTISASSSTPLGVTLPGGANSVEVFDFDITAGADDANVNIIALEMTAIGATSNISNVYIYEGTTRLTEARSVNASTRKATFGSLNLAIDAGTTRTFSVRIELAAAAVAGDEIRFSISDASDVTTGGGAVTGPPVHGNVFSIAAQNVGSVDVTKNGTISDPDLGGQDATVGQFKIAASSEDALISELTLKVDNAADHSDFKLWDGGDLLATGTYIGDKLVSFDLGTPFEITEGNSNIFSMSMDIGGESAETIGVYFDKSVDLRAIGADYLHGMTVNITTADGGTYDGDSNCNSSGDNCSFSTIQGGNVTITTNGPGSGDIRVNSQDQVLLNFSITSAQAITIKDLDIIVVGEDTNPDDNDPFDLTDDGLGDNKGLINLGAEGNIKDIKIVNADTGAVIMGPLELDCVTLACGIDGTSDASQTIDFTDDFGMVAGETLNLQVVVDVDNGVTPGTDFGATIDMSGFSAEDSNGDALVNATDVVPTGDLSGFAQEANEASLVISLASTPGDVTAVQGKDGEEVNAFNFVAGDAGDVMISSITVSISSDPTNVAPFIAGDATPPDVNDFISSCSLYDNAGALIDGPTSPAADGTNIVFSDADWTIAASAVERLSVQCNIGNPTEPLDRYFAFDLGTAVVTVADAIVAEDDEGTDVDPTGNAVNGELTPTNVLTVTESGTIAVTVDSSSPSADFVMTGSNDNLLAVFRLTASDEDFLVDKFTVTEEAGEDFDGVTNSSIYTNNISSITLEYTNSVGSTVTSDSLMAGNEATFSSLDLLVEYGDPSKVSVYVDVPSTDRSGGSATSNDPLELGVSDTAGDFNAAGVDSGITDTAAEPLTTGDRFIVKETSPTVTLNGSSSSGTGFVPGDQEVLRFDVAANSNEDVILSELVFKLASTDNAPTSWNFCDGGATGEITAADLDLYNLSTDGIGTSLDAADGEWSLLTTDGSVCTPDTDVVEFAHLTLATAETVPAGSTYTFALYFDSTGASAANDDSVQFSLPLDSFLGAASFLGASTLSGGHLITDSILGVAAGGGYTAGDIICLDENTGGCESTDELALVTLVAINNLTVVRGYLGTTPSALTVGIDVDRLPSTLYWEDDGDSGTVNTGDKWGGYLVDSLPVTGGAMGF
jgi:hypothetical protein